MQIANPDKALMQCAIGAALYGADNNAIDSVRAAVRDREQQLHDGEPGKRITTVRNRQRTTAAEITRLKSELEQAEARHFTALGGDSDASIESGRAEVLALSGRIQLLEQESEQLKQIAAEAHGAFGIAVEGERQTLHRDLVHNAQGRLTAARTAILDVFEREGLWPHFKSLAEAVEVMNIIGSDAGALRVSCDRNGLSDIFGTPRPANHISMRSPEYQNLDTALQQGARVRI